MSDWQPGDRERRKSWQDMEIHLAEIKRDVSYIKDRIDSYKRELDQHVRDDNKVHDLVTQHGSQITMLMWLFIVLIGTAIYQFAKH